MNMIDALIMAQVAVNCLLTGEPCEFSPEQIFKAGKFLIDEAIRIKSEDQERHKLLLTGGGALMRIHGRRQSPRLGRVQREKYRCSQIDLGNLVETETAIEDDEWQIFQTEVMADFEAILTEMGIDILEDGEL